MPSRLTSFEKQARKKSLSTQKKDPLFSEGGDNQQFNHNALNTLYKSTTIQQTCQSFFQFVLVLVAHGQNHHENHPTSNG